jgi:hypothetical protein
LKPCISRNFCSDCLQMDTTLCHSCSTFTASQIPGLLLKLLRWFQKQLCFLGHLKRLVYRLYLQKHLKDTMSDWSFAGQSNGDTSGACKSGMDCCGRRWLCEGFSGRSSLFFVCEVHNNLLSSILKFSLQSHRYVCRTFR